MSMKENNNAKQPMFHAGEEDRAEEGQSFVGEQTPSPEFFEEYTRRFGEMEAKWHEGGPKRQEADQLMSFGQEIRSARKELQISRKQLAERLHLSSDFLFFLESGLASPAEIAQVLDEVVEGLGVSLSELTDTRSDADEQNPEQSLPELFEI